MADCKRKTANLCPPINSAYGWVTGYRNGNSGDYVSNNTNYEWLSPFFELSAFGTSFTISADKSTAKDSMSVYYYNGDSYIGSQSSSNYNGTVFNNIPNGTTKFCFAIRAYAKNESEQIASGWRVWVNAGSTALPYEPYGWVHSLRKLATSTDTFTTLPANIYANGNNATVGISGNTVQNGTPTPDAPIMPQGTGERTGNLFDTILPSMNIDGSGKIIADNQFDLWIAQVTAGEEYTASAANGCYAFYASKPSAGSISIDGSRIISYSSIPFTVPNGANYIAIRYNKNSTSKMCNTGSILLPYEPYGYKIPISSANTTTPVYLGEVETTRRIKKLVLTGEETGWQATPASGGRNRFTLTITNAINADTANPFSMCTHLPLGVEGATWNTDDVYTITLSKIYMRLTAQYNTLADFKTYLQQQYAAGTPVIIWYVLAEPETAVVNEPLCKIGNYADTVSGITILTITGKDTVDVETSLKPSEVELTYTGWHDASVKEWDGSQWQ